MSRGLGIVERQVLEYLNAHSWAAPAWSLVQFLAGQRKAQPTQTLEACVRRALASLRRKGLVVQDENKQWRSVEAQAREKRRARREFREDEAFEKELLERARTAERQSPTRVLIKLLGMLGSDHDGEALAAARKVEAERTRLGKTWEETL